MPSGLPLALAMLVQASAVPPAGAAPAGSPPADAVAVKPAERPKTGERCETRKPSADVEEIIVCVQRPQGYRIDPDVMEASRAVRRRRLKPPESFKDRSCASVGPMGCGGGGIDLVSAGMVALTMIGKAARGENVGEMFITDPQPDEYQLYLEAKRRREAAEAEAAAKAKAAQAAPAAADPPTVPQ